MLQRFVLLSCFLWRFLLICSLNLCILWCYEHEQSVAYDTSMAPKECRVFGWLHPDSKKMVLLREFTYDLEKRNVQTFNVWENGYAVNMMRFEFTSNHGNPTHTCIYRFRVHGYEPHSLSSLVTHSSHFMQSLYLVIKFFFLFWKERRSLYAIRLWSLKSCC